MIIGGGDYRYEWIENWGGAPIEPTADFSARTHGVAASESNQVIVFRQSNPAVLIFDLDGKLLDAWGERFNGAHGMTLAKEGDAECLWLTDTRGEVVKTTLGGEMLLNLPPPDLTREDKYSPTWVAVNEERFGGNGDVWVADGYGQSYVHRYDKSGAYLESINGAEGSAGRFNCPHGIWIDNRTSDRNLYIADRGHKRIQVYDLNGKYKRAFGSDLLTSPCSFATDGRHLLIPELRAGLTIFNADERIEGRLGWNEEICLDEAWPDGTREAIAPGRFNSPHAMAADRDGNLYIVEWMIGGRMTKLRRLNETGWDENL